MTRVGVRREIEAPVKTVFRAVSEIEHFPTIQPDVLAIEFLTEKRSGLGTRFRETRRHGKREMVTELEVTEYAENEKVRIVTDSHGTVWDTLFEVRPSGARSELEITMDARPHRLLPRIMNPLMRGFFRKGITEFVELLAEHCESEARGASE